MIDGIINLECYPLHRPGSESARCLIESCQANLEQHGLFSLDGFLLPAAVEAALANARPEIQHRAFTHQRKHNGEFLSGDMHDIVSLPLAPGTLNVFRGRNTLHRVSPVVGGRDRIVSVFSYYENPGMKFTAEEQIGFYGRSVV